MPFLRFSRDRRGYESTYLVQPERPRAGGDRPRLLYWFRTPPHVKVGRAAFDEDAIRLLEEAHPDLEFDWDRILMTRPPAAPEPEDARQRRPERRGPREVRRAEPRRPPARPEPRSPSPVGPAVPVTPPQSVTSATPEAATVPAAPPDAPPIIGLAAPIVSAPPTSPPPVPGRRFVRVFDVTSDAPEHRASEVAVVERMLGAEQLTILRARYAEILARIAARGGDAARIEALREQAERANPDAWVTEAEVTAGLASLDATLAELHQLVGRRRRRRRRRRDPGAPAPAGAEASAAPGPNLADDDEEEEAAGEEDELAEGQDE